MTDEKNPSIAEKVQFWQEQDKINLALIPRVIEMHETLRGLSKRTESISTQIATAEARVLERVRSQLNDQATSVSAQLAAVEAQTLERVRELSIATESASSQRNSPERSIAFAALVLAVLACALSFYNLFS